MTIFTSSLNNDVANATSGILTGWTGGTLFDLQDGIGDEFIFGDGADTAIAGSGNDVFAFYSPSDVTVGFEYIDGQAGIDTLALRGIEAIQFYDFRGSTVLSTEAVDFHADGTSQGDRTIALTSSQIGVGGISATAQFIANPYAGDTNAIVVDMNTASLNLSGWLFTQWDANDTITINSSPAPGTIVGTSQNDSISIALSPGTTGRHTVDAGDGNDTVTVDFSAFATGSQLDLSGGGTEWDSGPGAFNYAVSLTHVENLHAIGGSGNDLFTGDAGDDELIGNDGNDTLNGGTGSDTLIGGAGNDDLTVTGVGADVLDGGSGNDRLHLTRTDLTDNQTIVLAPGIGFTLSDGTTASGFEFLNLVSGSGDDTISITPTVAGRHTVDTGDGNDTVTVDFSAFATGSQLDLSGGGTEWDSGPGAFNYAVSLTHVENLHAIGGSGNDLFTGDAGDDELIGNDGNDTLNGGTGSDTLIGGAGNDDLTVTGVGADVLDGGSGNDRLHLTRTDLTDNQTIVLAPGIGFTLSDGTTASGFEFLNLVSGSGDDTISITPTVAGRHTVDAGDGNDTVTVDFSAFATGSQLDLSGGGTEWDSGPGAFNYAVSLTHVENLHAIGGSGNDLFTGDAGDDELIGNDGNDTLNGGTGSDTLIGGAGSDHLDGGANGVAGDTLSYAGSDAEVTVNLATNSASGGHATGDTISGFENLVGSAYDDTLTGDGGDNVIEGGGGADHIDGGANGAGGDTLSFAGSDVGVTVDLLANTASGGHATGDTISNFENLIGSAHADTLTGNDADNVLSGRGGADHLDGGGNGAMGDTASYAGSAAGVTVNLNTGAGTGGDAEGDTLVNIENLIGSPFADRLTGNGAVNRLWGGDGNDLLNASLAGDFLYGEGGDDTLIGGQGADLLDGGANGAAGDTASYSNSALGVTVDLLAGTASGGDAEGDTLTGIENLLGSAQADTLTGDGNANALTGGDGGDTLSGGGGADTLYGNNGDDMLVGGDGADYLHGGAGSDTVSYAGGAVGVTARIGITGSGGEAEGDVYMAVENFIGTDQDDRLDGSVAVNRLQGMGGNDYLVGGDASDILEGGDGNDTLVGGNGGDTLDGGDGVDTANYYSSTTGVWVNLLAGTASLGHASGDTLVSIENVTGSYAGANRLTGDNGDNVLIGYAGADRLTGNGGNDTLYGGNDTVRDLFIYSSAGFGQDSVRQFHNGEDIIDLRGLGLTFADVHAVQSGTSTVLTFTGLAGDQITLTSFTATNIDATDFYF